MEKRKKEKSAEESDRDIRPLNSAVLIAAGDGIYSAPVFTETKLMSVLSWSRAAAAAASALMCFYL